MIEIIATAAVSGLLTGTAIGFSLARPWQDWTIKRDIERDLVRNRLRKSLEEARTQIDWLRSDARSSFDTAVALRIERDEARAALTATGKPDQPRDPVTGRWLAKPIKSGDYTINKPDAKPTPDDGWIKWTGGECPVPEDSCIEVKLRTGGTHGQLGPRDWIWSHDPADPAWDIIAYRIVSAEQREAA